jgi:hypothetical protein
MLIAGREVSVHEIHHAHSARWFWDRRYLTEVEQERLSPPLDESILQEIDTALSRRYSMANHIIIKGYPYGKRLPFFRSRIPSDSPRIQAAIDKAQPGDIVKFDGVFFLDKGPVWKGQNITYTGMEPYARMYFLSSERRWTSVAEDARDLYIRNFDWRPVPPNWIVRGIMWLFRRNH